MNYINWKNKSSDEIDGLLICELPPITKPKMRVKETSIDGVDGSTFEELGYESYDKTIKIGLRNNFDIDEVIDYFTGEGNITFSNEEDKYYKAKIINQIDFNRLLRFRTADIKFRVQPFKYSAEEIKKTYEAVNEVSGNSSVSLTNVIADNFNKISIFGKSTQGANPSPSNPQTITSITGTITITITNGTQTQTLNVNLGANELCSIGDIKDELVIANGNAKIIKRIRHITRAIADMNNSENYPGWVNVEYIGNDYPNQNRLLGEITSYLSNFSVQGENKVSINSINNASTLFLNRTYNNNLTQTQWKTNYPDLVLHLYYEIPTPTEIDLGSVTQPTTYAGTTNVSNNKSADMTAIGYKVRTFSVTNSGNYKSKPLIKITGSGTIEFKLENVNIFSYTFPTGDTYVEIDSDKQDAYIENTLKNRNMSGEFPILKIGRNIISWTGQITNIEISNYSRWI